MFTAGSWNVFIFGLDVMRVMPSFRKQNLLTLQATVVCDIVLLYLLKNGDLYKDKKYLYVTGDDAFKVRQSPRLHRNYSICVCSSWR